MVNNRKYSYPLIFLEPTEDGVVKAWNFCRDNENSHCIEITYKDEEQQVDLVTKVYFNVDLKVRQRMQFDVASDCT